MLNISSMVLRIFGLYGFFIKGQFNISRFKQFISHIAINPVFVFVKFYIRKGKVFII